MKNLRQNKPLWSSKITNFELTNVVTGWLLAKTSAIITIKDIEISSVKYLNESMFEYVSPLIIIGVICLFVLNEKKKKTKDALQCEKYEYVLNGLFCVIIGVAAYIIFILLGNCVLVNVEQSKMLVHGLLPYEWSLSVMFALIWGNVISFTHNFKD